MATTGTITVTDTLPAGLTLTTASGGTGWTIGAKWTCTGVAGGTVVSCTRTVAIAASTSNVAVVIFPVTVAAAAAPSVTNTASISNPNESTNLVGNNSSTIVTPVDAPDLVVTKSHNGNFTVGTNGVYPLTVSSLGALTTSTADVVVTDTLPAGLTFVTGTGTGWTACTAAGQVVTCVRPLANPIAANASAPPITLTVSVGAAAATASPVTNNVSVAGGNEPAGNNGNNTDSDITFVYYSPVITKAFSPATVVAGVPSTLTLTISNPAGNPASLAGLAVVDPFPAGMSVASTPSFSNTCGGTTPVNNLLAFTETLPAGVVVATAPVATQCNGTVAATVGTVGTGVVTFSGGTLSLGQASCSNLVNVLSATAGTYNNLPANVTGFGTNIINTVTATLTVGTPSLIFLKTVAVLNDPVNGVSNPKNIPGAEVLYTLRVTNTGTGTVDLNKTVVTDPISLNADLFVGDLSGASTGPIQFVQGTPTSALSCTYTTLNSVTDDVGFYGDSACTTLIVPTALFDTAVRCIRLNPKGIMAGTGGGSPSFELRFKARVK